MSKFKNFKKRNFEKLFLFWLNSILKQKDTLFFGSEYGGWKFVHKESLDFSTIISAGVGEDISFDIEFINKYNSRVLLIDPTPRSKSYIKELFNYLGNKKTKDYDPGGYQQFSSYDLRKINKNNLIFVYKALFDINNKIIKLLPPENLEHVSYSFKKNKKQYKTTNVLEAKTITVNQIIENYKLNNLELLKLDIEGSEVFVLRSLIKDKVFPNQILVELDSLRDGKLLIYLRIVKLILKLLRKKYALADISRYPNILLYRTK